jgi:hypothetical protein
VAQPLLAVQKGRQGRKQHSQEWLCHRPWQTKTPRYQAFRAVLR